VDQGGTPIRDLLLEVEGMVVDLALTDGSKLTGVVLGVSPTAVILDRWGEAEGGPAGDPIVCDLAEIVTVDVP
jgi:hypothetical protein